MNDPAIWAAVAIVAAVAFSVLPDPGPPVHTTPTTVHFDRSVERVVQRITR